jgi:predicted  nucleic acid-binding Zn-ribbon protein
VTPFEPLLALQERDHALDRLRHRRENLPERAQLRDAQAHVTALRNQLETRGAVLAEVARRERALSDEAQALGEQATAVDRKLYSGEISSPRELQALQADIDQLRKQQRNVEERAIEAMEEREPLDAEVAALEAEVAACEQTVAAARAAVASQEAAVDEEMRAEEAQRAELRGAIDAGLLAEYEQRRLGNRGTGVARLVADTCQGCRLSIPATEVDRIRHGTGDVLAFCDNCGCILVP